MKIPLINAIAKINIFIHPHISFIINNIVTKCIENIFYLIFSTDSNQQSMCIFSCGYPFNVSNVHFYSAIYSRDSEALK